jgi:hypothetical protein
VGDAIPDAAVKQDNNYFLPAAGDQAQKTLGSSIYVPTVSGSLVSSDAQLFNRPFWLQRAQGHNNGICWENQLFVTVVDNTRNTNFTISVSSTDQAPTEYNASNTPNFREYLRHVEEYELSVILQLCRVPLQPDILAHINAMNSNILEEWQLGFVPTPENPIQDTYRYINSAATRCPDKNTPKEKEDQYAKFNFWTVDLTEKLSLGLDQYSLGRKFLYQAGLKRSATPKTTTARNTVTRGVKRKRT